MQQILQMISDTQDPSYTDMVLSYRKMEQNILRLCCKIAYASHISDVVYSFFKNQSLPSVVNRLLRSEYIFCLWLEIVAWIAMAL